MRRAITQNVKLTWLPRGIHVRPNWFFLNHQAMKVGHVATTSTLMTTWHNHDSLKLSVDVIIGGPIRLELWFFFSGCLLHIRYGVSDAQVYRDWDVPAGNQDGVCDV